METLETAVAAAIEGDLSGFAIIVAANHSDLLKAATNLPQLLVSRSSLASVLQEWQGGFQTADNIQQWASFVRRGYVSGKGPEPTLPLDIKYDPIDEELIVEIIGRLDEIGDLVDGDISDSEREEMLCALQK